LRPYGPVLGHRGARSAPDWTPELKLRALFRLATFVTILAAGAGAAMAAPPGERGADERAIDDAVCADSIRAETWNATWAIVFSVAAVGGAGYATFAPREWLDSDSRAALYVTAIKATAGAIDKLVAPLHIDGEGLCHDSPSTSGKARYPSLVEAAQRERRAVLTGVFGGLLLNSAGLLYLGHGRHAWQNAWISFSVGTAVGVVSALTAPRQAWLLDRRLNRSHHIAAVPIFGSGSTGLAIALTW
jgi:hypothetical protein